MTPAIRNTKEYTVKDTCLAITLHNGHVIFADGIFDISNDYVVYVPRGGNYATTVARNLVNRITVGIYEIP